MFAGSGSMIDMMNRMKQNRALLPSKRSKFKENRKDNLFISNKVNKQKIDNKVSEEELIDYKNKILKYEKKGKIMEFSIYGIVAICLLIIIILFF